MNNTQFNHNTAGTTGGVVHADLNSTITAENSTIHNNIIIQQLIMRDLSMLTLSSSLLEIAISVQIQHL